MARFGINTGSTANDGQGDTLRAAMGKINSNFLEIYTTLGDTNNVISYASTAGISTVARNLTGNPRINVGGILNTGITTTEHLEVRNIKSTGIVTAVQFVGDGSQLSNVTATNPGVEILDDNVRRGVAKEINFGANIISSGPDGLGRVTISVASGNESTNYANSAGVATYASSAGIASYSTVAGIASNLSGTPNLNVGIVTATSFRGDGSLLTGVTAQGTGITVEDDNIQIGVAQTINFGSNLTVGPLVSGRLTVDASGIATGLSGAPNITVGNINAGVVTATNFIGDGSGLTGVVVSAAGTWTSNNAGIHTVKNVGIGSTLPSSKLSVEGSVLISGVSTVTTPNGRVTIGSTTTLIVEGDTRITGILTIGNSSITIDSNNNTIAVGSGVTINGNSGVITATSFVGSGANLTGIITSQDIVNSLVGYATTGYVQNYISNIAGIVTVGFVTTQIGLSTFSKDYYDLRNLPFIPVLLNDFSDVNAPSPTPGQVLKWSGSQWEASSDLTGAGGGGSGIGLSDLSVVQNAVGLSSLTYNSSTGVFNFTPPDLTGYATTVSLNSAVFNSANWDTAYSWGNHALAGYTTTGYVAGAISTVTSALAGFTTTGDVNSIIAGYGYATGSYVLTQIGLSTFTGAATTITTTNISNWNVAYGWGNHATQGYLTSYSESDTLSSVLSRGNSSIYGINLSGTSGILTATGINLTGVATATSFKVPGGTSSQFLKADGSFDANTYLSNVTITAGANITVVETSEGNFIITSTGAGGGGSSQWTTVASGIVTSSNVGIGTTVANSTLTVEGNGRFSGIVTATRFESSSAGTPTIDSPNNLNINAVTVAISTDTTVGRELRIAGITTVNAGGIRVAGIVTATEFDINGTTTTITSGGISVSGVTTSTSFRTNSTVGDGTDVGFAIKYYITSNGFSGYRFAGPGIVNTIDNPTLYLHRGFTYIFENSTGGSHPFAIRYSSGGTGYGATYLSGSQTGTQVFTIPFDAPASLVYQCTIHSGMLGTLTIVA